MMLIEFNWVHFKLYGQTFCGWATAHGALPSLVASPTGDNLKCTGLTI